MAAGLELFSFGRVMEWSLRTEMALSAPRASLPIQYSDISSREWNRRVFCISRDSKRVSCGHRAHCVAKFGRVEGPFSLQDEYILLCKGAPVIPSGNRTRNRSRHRKACFRVESSHSDSVSTGTETSHTYVLSMGIPSQKDGNSSVKLENIIQEAVFDVVRNIQEAPFFHLIFDKSNGRKSTVKKKLSPNVFHVPEGWTAIKDSILQDSPDGIILVRSLDQDEVVHTCGLNQDSFDQECRGCALFDDSTSFWGVVVQSRSSKRHVCYILKTTRVQSAGFSCTSFTLTKANHFGSSPNKQLEASWLL